MRAETMAALLTIKYADPNKVWPKSGGLSSEREDHPVNKMGADPDTVITLVQNLQLREAPEPTEVECCDCGRY
jgi:hypothetical protein